MVDVIITTYGRLPMLKVTLETLAGCLKDGPPHRIFIADDGSADGTQEYLRNLSMPNLAYVVLGKERRGVVFNFNLLCKLVEYHDWFYAEYPYLCYLQDDMKSPGANWLAELIHAYEELKGRFGIGFFSGYDAPEHPAFEKTTWRGERVLLKRSLSASNMIAPKAYWRKLGYVPRVDPSGAERGFPGNGRGSNIDIYLTGCMSQARFVEQSACKGNPYSENLYSMVIPRLEHMALSPECSTWRKDRG